VQASTLQFTAEFVNHPYDVPNWYTTDEYTGETILHQGYHAQNYSIEVTISNQNLDAAHTYFNIRVKGHFGDSWRELYTFRNGSEPSYTDCPQASNTQNTLISLSADYQNNSQVDIQIKQITAHVTTVSVPLHWMAPELGSENRNVLVIDSESEWSQTQTLTVTKEDYTIYTPAPSPDSSTSQTTDQNYIGNDSNLTRDRTTWTTIIAGVAAIVTLTVTTLYLKSRKIPNRNKVS
jgi:hypothetical protein